MLEAHYAVPMLGAVLNALNFRLDAATIAFILEHGEAKALITDRELSPVVGPALEQLGQAAAGDRHRRRARRGGRAFGRNGLRGFPRDRRSGLPARPAARRMAVDLPALHLGHHGQSQGRGLSPSGRLPERRRQPDHLRPAAGLGLPLEPADVPLQRLDLHLGRDRRGGDPRLPAQGRPGADLPFDPGPWRDPHVRRADRAHPAGPRARSQGGGLRAHGGAGDRRRRAAQRGDRGDGRRSASGCSTSTV